jgi:hypothetical protein
MAGHRLLMKADGEESGVPGTGGVPGHGPVRIDDSVQRPSWVPGHHVPGGMRAGSDLGGSAELSLLALAGTTFPERGDRLGDASLPRLIGFGSCHLQHVPRLVGVGESVEGATRLGLSVERRREVRWEGHFSGCGIELDIDCDAVPSGEAGRLSVLGADTEHARSAHGPECRTVGVAIDGDANRWSLARAEGLDDVGRYLDPRRVLAGRRQSVIQSHRSLCLG